MSLRPSAALFAAVAIAAISCSPLAPVADRPDDGHHEADFRATSHRRFDDVAHWQQVFDAADRPTWQKPEELLRAVGVEQGMRVADIGAGTGFFLPYLSRAVGPSGRVVALEVEPALVTHMQERVRREGLINVEVRLTPTIALAVPPGSVDVALLVDAYHHIDDRRAYLPTLVAALAPRGRVAVVDWKPGELPIGPRDEAHKVPAEQVVREMKSAGFEQVPTEDILPFQYVLAFTRAKR